MGARIKLLLTIVILCIATWTSIRSFLFLDNKPCSHDEAFTELVASGHSLSDVLTANSQKTISTFRDLYRFQITSSNNTIPVKHAVLFEDAPHLPAYYMFVSAVQRVSHSGLTSARAFSATLRIIIPLLAGWLVFAIFESTVAAMIATAMFYVSPFQMQLGITARDYSLALSLILAAAIAFFIWVKHSDKPSLIKFTFLTFLSSSLSAFSLGLLSAQAGYLFSDDQLKAKDTRRHFVQTVAIIILLYAVMLALSAHAGIALFAPKFESDHADFKYLILSICKNLIQNFIDLNDGIRLLEKPYIFYVGFISILITIAFASSLSDKQKRIKLLVLIALVNFVPLFALDVFNSSTFFSSDRHLVLVQFVSTILVARRIQLWIENSAGKIQFAGWASLVISLGLGLWSCENVLLADSWPQRTISSANRAIVTILNSDPSSTLISGSTGTRPGNLLALSHELNPNIRLHIGTIDRDTLDSIRDHKHQTYIFNPTADERKELEANKYFLKSSEQTNTLFAIIADEFVH